MCPFPLLPNFYSENIFQEAIEGQKLGIKVNDTWINNIWYADDTVLIADNNNDLQRLLDIIDTLSAYGNQQQYTKDKVSNNHK